MPYMAGKKEMEGSTLIMAFPTMVKGSIGGSKE